ncbi:hypothetical protein CHUAL_006116 [Chamberlinius hualienensis]
MAELVQSSTSAVCVDETDSVTTPPLRLKLRKPKNDKKVAWSSDTVDNEHMNKKKSKCCCVYEKPRQFDESSSDTDDECDHCRGHVEKKKANHEETNPPSSS